MFNKSKTVTNNPSQPQAEAAVENSAVQATPDLSQLPNLIEQI